MNGSEPPDGINGTAYERWSLFAPWRSFTFRSAFAEKFGFLILGLCGLLVGSMLYKAF